MNVNKFKAFLIIVFIVIFIGFSVFALYTNRSSDIHLQKSNNFLFSSNFLSADTVPMYQLYGGGQQSFSFELRNFEDSLRFSDNSISYNVQAVGLDNVIIDNSLGSLTGGEANQNVVTITIPQGYTDGSEILITAESTPYYKKISAKLKLHAPTTIGNYYVEDNVGQTCAKLIICAESEFTPIIQWADSLAIDCTNIYVADSNGTINPSVESKNLTLNTSVKKYESISIYFFKTNVSANYSKPKMEIDAVDNQILVGI